MVWFGYKIVKIKPLIWKADTIDYFNQSSSMKRVSVNVVTKCKKYANKFVWINAVWDSSVHHELISIALSQKQWNPWLSWNNTNKLLRQYSALGTNLQVVSTSGLWNPNNYHVFCNSFYNCQESFM